jgi:branched-chain amino acid aminotransferase
LNNLINFNGRFTEPDTLVATAFNRSLRYGDGLFETMLWNGRQIHNLNYHMDRLFRGLEVLQFDLSGGFDRSFVTESIVSLCLNNAHQVAARVRLNVFREDSITLLPQQNRPLFIIETGAVDMKISGPLRVSLYKAETKPTGILSNLKTNNYLLNVLAAQHAKESGYDDAIILNSRGNICEASSSNVFMVQKGILFTPALSQGCVAGTKRRELLQILPTLGYQVEETIITKDMIFEMEEVFFTNAIRNIRPVICIENTYYSREVTTTIVGLLTKSEH